MFNNKASSQDDHVACSRRGNSTSYDYQRLSVQAISVHIFLPYQCIHYKKWPNHGLVGRRYSTRSDFENGGPVILILAAIIACIRSCVTRGDGPKASINLCEKYHAYAIYIFPPCHYIGLELKFSVSSCSSMSSQAFDTAIQRHLCRLGTHRSSLSPSSSGEIHSHFQNQGQDVASIVEPIETFLRVVEATRSCSALSEIPMIWGCIKYILMASPSS